MYYTPRGLPSHCYPKGASYVLFQLDSTVKLQGRQSCNQAGPSLPFGTWVLLCLCRQDMFAEKVWLKICCETKVPSWEQFS